MIRTQFFQGVASSRKRINRIFSLVDWERRLESKEEIVKHNEEYFVSLYSKDLWERSSLDNLEFGKIGDGKAQTLERNFEEEEFCEAIFAFAGDKDLGPDAFPMACFQRFWIMLKDDILDFMVEFHSSGKLSKGIGAFFIALILKKEGENGIKDFRSISLIGSVYRILAKVLTGRLQKILPLIISKEKGAFVKGRQSFSQILLVKLLCSSKSCQFVGGSY